MYATINLNTEPCQALALRFYILNEMCYLAMWDSYDTYSFGAI